jgi:hypothetical protein
LQRARRTKISFNYVVGKEVTTVASCVLRLAQLVPVRLFLGSLLACAPATAPLAPTPVRPARASAPAAPVCGSLLFQDRRTDGVVDPIDTWRAMLETRSFRTSLGGAPPDGRIDTRRVARGAVVVVRASASAGPAAAALCSAALKGALARSSVQYEARRKNLEQTASRIRLELAQLEEAELNFQRASDRFWLVSPDAALGQLQQKLAALDPDDANPRIQKRLELLRKDAVEIAIKAIEWRRLRANSEWLNGEQRRIRIEQATLEHVADNEVSVLDECGPCDL